MALRFFNTYSRELEEFRPLDPSGRAVKMYTCGPTVYSHAHIGNFRAYIFEDLAPAPSRSARLHGRPSDEPDRRGRQNDPRQPRGAICRCATSPRPSRKHFSRTSIRCRSNAPTQYPAATERTFHRGDDRDDRKVDRARPRLPGGGQIGLLSDQSFPRTTGISRISICRSCARPAA